MKFSENRKCPTKQAHLTDCWIIVTLYLRRRDTVPQNYKNEKFDLIIQAGQSNAEGCGYGPIATPFEPSDRIIALDANLHFSRAGEKQQDQKIISNFALAFADLYVKNGFLSSDRKALILLNAVGGTGFSDNRWKTGDDLREKLIASIRYALNLNPENRAVVFLWHQGETDAGMNAAYDFYKKHFSDLLHCVRSECGNDNLPFICGDFVQNWKKTCLEQCRPVIQAQKDICTADPHGRFVETEGLSSNFEENGPESPSDTGDIIHFSRQALYTLGERYFTVFSDMNG